VNISYRRKRLYFALIFSLFASALSVVQISQAQAVPAGITDPCNSAFYSTTATSPVTLTYVACSQGRTWQIPTGVTSLTISLYGGAGGNGGNDSQPGGSALTAEVLSGTLDVSNLSSLVFGVGGGGVSGSGCYGNYPGGNGGNGNWGGFGDYSGGKGGTSGSAGCSGSGGGGGASTKIQLTYTGGAVKTLFAGGGGGGGGGDNCTRGKNSDTDPAGGATFYSRTGQNASQAPGDGGGAGGGGGGTDEGNAGLAGRYIYPCGESIGYGGAHGHGTTAGLSGLSIGTYNVTPSANGYIAISWAKPPLAPTISSAVAGNQQATVTWVSGGDNGKTITGYTVTASPGGATCTTANVNATSCAVTGLTNGTSYTFTVTATNGDGTGPASSASLAVIPSTTCAVSESIALGIKTLSLSNGYCTWLNNASGTLDVKVIGTGVVYSGNNLSVANGQSIALNSTLIVRGTAQFAYPLPYTLTYDSNTATSGSAPSAYTTTTGFETRTVSTNSGTLVKTNYGFNGWNTQADGNGTPYATGSSMYVNGNIRLYAKWSQFTLSYASTGADGGGLAPVALTSGGSITLGTGTLKRNGYYFNGWNTQADGGGVHYDAGASYQLTATTTLYPQWARYLLTFNTNNSDTGTVPTAISGYDTVTVSSNTGSLAKNHYYFNGWNTQADGNGTPYAPLSSFVLRSNQTLYAKYSQYTLAFAAGNATTGTPPNSIVDAGSITLPNSSSLSLSGWAWAGWNTVGDGSGQFYAPGATYSLTGSTTLYPYFTKYSLRYDTGTATSGSVPSTFNGAGSTTLSANSGSLAKTNYYFSGWNTQANGLGTPYAANSSFTLSGNSVLYPAWSQWTVTYNMNGSTNGTPFTTSGAGSTTLAASANTYTKTNYILSGWTTQQDTGTVYALGATLDITGDATLWAKWKGAPVSSISITNTSRVIALGTATSYTQGHVDIKITETPGAHSSSSLVATATGTNCSISGAPVTTWDALASGETNQSSGFFLDAPAIANCSVIVSRPSDSNYSQSISSPVAFQFYPINQTVSLLVDTSTVTQSVGTPIQMKLRGLYIGSGDGVVSYAAYGNNCYLTTTGSDYFLNATTPTNCQVVVTRAADKQWAIATSQVNASFTFEAVAQSGFYVVSTSDTTTVGSSLELSTTGGNGNGAVSYKTFGANCSISNGNLSSTAVGNCAVVAYKSATGYYSGQTSVTKVFAFTTGSQSPVTIASDAALYNAVSPSYISLTYTGGSGTGGVTYVATPSSNCSISNANLSAGTARLSAITFGSCTVTAYKSGDAGYSGVNSNALSIAFGVVAPTLTLTSDKTTTDINSSITLGVSGGAGVGSGAITFARYNNGNCYFTDTNTVTGTAVLRSTGVGSCFVQATQAANAGYLANQTSLTPFSFTGGTQSALTLTFNSPETSTSTTSGSTMHILTTGGSGAGAFSYTVSSLNNATCANVIDLSPGATDTSTASVRSSTPGTCQVTVVKSGSQFYSYQSATTNFVFSGQSQGNVSLTATPVSASAGHNSLITFMGGAGTGAYNFTVSGSGCTLNGQSNNTINVTASIKTSCYVSGSKAQDATYVAATTYPGIVVNFGLDSQTSLNLKIDSLSSGYSTTKTADLSYYIEATGGSGTGLVSFAAYGNGNCKLDTSTVGVALLTSTFSIATCNVVGYKAADSRYSAVSSNSVPLSFTAASQAALTITPASITSPIDTPLALTVAGGNSGSYSYSVNNSTFANPHCTLTDTTTASPSVSASAIGTCSVTVVRSSSGIYGSVAATSVSLSFGSTGDLTLVPTDNVVTPVAGTGYLLTPTSSTGGTPTYTIYAGACTSSYNLGTNRITLNASFPTTCTVSVKRTSSGGNLSQLSNSLTVTFVAASQNSITLSASPASPAAGDNVTVTATGGSGTGLFNFVIYQSSSNCSLVSQDRTAGTAVISSPVSTICSVQATRSGSGIYTYALSNTLPITWGTIAQQIPLVISNDPTSANAGETITVTTVGGQGDGAITFRELSYSPSCILTADGHLFRASYGTCSVQATKAGDSIYSSQKSQIIRFTFYGSQAQSALTISNTLLTASVGSPITLTTLGGSSSGRVSYVITGGTGAGSIQGSTLVGSRTGTITVVATKDGDQQYGSVVSAPITFTITG
jgi:uncharacterized repeat protein (TIGR02543 family)